MKNFATIIMALSLVSISSFAQDKVVDFKIESKTRVLSKITESVSKCVAIYVGGQDCTNKFQFTVVSRVISQKWLQSNEQMIPGSFERVEEVISERIDERANVGTLLCRDDVILDYCRDIVQSPYTGLIGRLNRN
jgi:hypothetical protein